MERHPARPDSLIDRLDVLSEVFGAAGAQSYIGGGDPDEDPCELTFSEFVGQVRRRSNALVALGVGPREVITFAAPLSETSYPTMIAGMVSATLAPVNYFLEADALLRVVKATGASVLLIHRSFTEGAEIVGKLKHIHQALPNLRLLSFGTGAPVEGAMDIEAVVATRSPSSWDTPARSHPVDRVAALLHTGGTTGLAKLVPHTEAMYHAMIGSCGAGEGTAPGESILSGLPLFHTSGILQAGLVPLFNGTRLVIPSSRGFRDPKVIANYWNFVRRYGISIGAGVPTVLAALTAVEPGGPITTIKRFLVGGAPVSRTTIAKIHEITGGADVIEGWGMTETCGFCVMNPHGRAKLGSVGVPFPGVAVEIRRFDREDGVGTICKTDEIGELVVRGDIVIKNYFDERPGAFTTDGWLRTGDLGRADEDGYLWITGRSKDLIIRGGHNIDPAIIEEPAYQHPAVQLAAAIGKPDKYAGELPVLYVQLKPEARTSEGELADFLRERIAERAAMPKSIIIVPEIPLSGPGKISKLLLRREAISSAFQDELDRLALGRVEIRANITDDNLLGEVVVLHCSGMKPTAQHLREVAATLEGYAIPYRWADGTAAP